MLGLQAGIWRKYLIPGQIPVKYFILLALAAGPGLRLPEEKTALLRVESWRFEDRDDVCVKERERL